MYLVLIKNESKMSFVHAHPFASAPLSSGKGSVLAHRRLSFACQT